jgi:hypothetical protein
MDGIQGLQSGRLGGFRVLGSGRRSGVDQKPERAGAIDRNFSGDVFGCRQGQGQKGKKRQSHGAMMGLGTGDGREARLMKGMKGMMKL